MEGMEPVWREVETLLSEGFSIIPVRDRPDENNPERFPAKSPYTGWKEFQSKVVTKDRLWFEMDTQYKTTAVAIICGNISGHLEVIDLDTKYYPGIDGLIFQDLKLTYPDIAARLRVHKTPSGGYHLLYRVDGEVSGNMKLASRYATESELLANPKQKKKCFIETRGEGGYIVAPPSLNYKVVKNLPVPMFTYEERCSFINFFKSYDEIIEVKEPPKINTVEFNSYDESPFEHYNRTCDPVELMVSNGWSKFPNSNNRFAWFTRPDKGTGISASFNYQKRVFFVFTTSTNLDAPRGYNPATLLAHFQFNGDKKSAFRYLVEKGYGKLKPNVEKQIIERSIINGSNTPGNISDEGKKLLDELKQKQDELYPYGIFWNIGDRGSVEIDFNGLLEIATGLGFRVYSTMSVLCRIVGGIVVDYNEPDFYNELKAYIKEEDGDLYSEICRKFEEFVARYWSHVVSKRLVKIQDEEFLHDSKYICYKYFKNGILKITKDSVILMPYSKLNNLKKLIHKDRIQNRSYDLIPYDEDCKYLKFLQLSVELDKKLDYVMGIIGYLVHDYKDRSMSYIIAGTEMCEDVRQGGGTGKNVLFEMLSHSISYYLYPGSQCSDVDEDTFQGWRNQKLFVISDPNKRFDWKTLKQAADGDITVHRMYKDRMVLGYNETPKFVVVTNYAVRIDDGGVKRRVINLEFTDFFKKVGGVNGYFKGIFPDCWNQGDWIGYDQFIVLCIQQWFKSGYVLKNNELSEEGKVRQFEITFGSDILEFIDEHIETWKTYKDLKNKSGSYKVGCVPNKVFEESIKKYFTELGRKPIPKTKHISDALSEYCFLKNIKYENTCQVGHWVIDAAGGKWENCKCKKFDYHDSEEVEQDGF